MGQTPTRKETENYIEIRDEDGESGDRGVKTHHDTQETQKKYTSREEPGEAINGLGKETETKTTNSERIQMEMENIIVIEDDDDNGPPTCGEIEEIGRVIKEKTDDINKSKYETDHNTTKGKRATNRAELKVG